MPLHSVEVILNVLVLTITLFMYSHMSCLVLLYLIFISNMFSFMNSPFDSFLRFYDGCVI